MAVQENTGRESGQSRLGLTSKSPTMDDGDFVVKPYQIHVPSKHLDRTKQKLELTRLPHEGQGAQSTDFWEPRGTVERLVDSWLDGHSWREYENKINTALPQVRTVIPVTGSEGGVRLHCIHIRSRKAGSVPLLLIPPFPFANISLLRLVELFTNPKDEEAHRFHLVVPSFPGIGFSDPLPNDAPPIATTAQMFDTLMSRLSYPHYLVTNSGPSCMSPAQIDWKLAHHLATHHSESCVGAHLISPPLVPPRPKDNVVAWGKWKLASFFHAPMWGYNSADFEALDRVSGSNILKARKKVGLSLPAQVLPAITATAQLGLDKIALHDPNALAYALCDSPTGLLVFMLKALRALGGNGEVPFEDNDLINLVLLAWIPGPEYGLRFWASCVRAEQEFSCKKVEKQKKKKSKPRVAVTVFLGDDGNDGNDGVEEYSSPGWANINYDLVFSRRVCKRAGLLAWTRPEEIVAGVQGLAREILKVDSNLQAIVTADIPGEHGE